MIRPEISAVLSRWREVIAAGGVCVFGLWLIWLGGWFLMPLGALVIAIGLGWAVIGWRRLRFARAISAPGLVDVVEGRISYFAASRAQALPAPGGGAPQGLGGEVALRELVEIRLLRLSGRQYWRLRTREGEAIMIPLDAAGAEALYDAFASLPGIDMGELSAAPGRALAMQALWRRK
ncbi:hypothetical protein DL1_04120 [Thioclava dalianensis]|uniref:Uncharacterized protein n=1 Tax=Thioclava dalianensis TaxID=1185766 RepID=A0A074TK97_9RHOB|nr:hypothetical protein [Thioclava dalianensis]KEP69408.1 hypothetical protein DL1_04120 [Thioclava dalianensis]